MNVRGHPTPNPAEGIAANGRPAESVWSYPRPPRIEREDREVVVFAGPDEIARSARALRVCETAGAPVVYVPVADIADGALRPAAGKTLCEFKGTASYFDVRSEDGWAERGAWTYRKPTAGYTDLLDHYSFYPARLRCLLAGEIVQPQPGGFYGGWVTAEIRGPIKGEPGSERW